MQSSSNPRRQPVLLIHGGAWAMPDDAVDAHKRGIANALAAGWAALERGGTSVDAVEAAVTIMEDDDTFDAGRGSFLTRDGRVQLDALLMNGENLRTGGVACVERLRNPIQAARLVLDKSPHVYFVGDGAEQFASQHGMPLIDNADLIVPRERQRLTTFQRNEAAGGSDTTFSGNSEFTTPPSTHPSSPHDIVILSNAKDLLLDRTTTNVSSRRDPGRAKQAKGEVERPASGSTSDPSPSPRFVGDGLQPVHSDPDKKPASAAEGKAVPPPDPTLHSHDTVGAVALDQFGNLAAATSTGGTLSKAPGRVGDSSLIGCGCYADNLSAAVSLTGWGEPIMKLVLGKWAVDRVASGATPQAAAEEAIAYLYTRLGGHGGIILLGPDGSLGLAHNTPRMAWGIANASGQTYGITRNA